MAPNDSEAILTRYLLGKATDSEQQRIEDDVLTDDAAFARLGVVEDDLIDAYVRGDLASGERRQFEERWLTSPRRRARVELAFELAKIAEPADPVAERPGLASWWASLMSPWQLQLLKPVAALGLLVAVAGLVWLQNVNSGLRSRIAQLEAMQESVADRAAASLVQTSLTLLLEPHTRGDGYQKLSVSSQVQSIKLQILLDEDEVYPSFDASLSRVRDHTLKAWDGLEAGRSVLLEVPADLVPGGRFGVELRGREIGGQASLIGYYEFEIVPSTTNLKSP